MTDNSPPQRRGFPLKALAIAAFAAVLIYLFFGEHRVHLLGWLPFLFLLACPLLHFTMHGGHGHHHGQGGPSEPDSSGSEAPPHQHNS